MTGEARRRFPGRLVAMDNRYVAEVLWAVASDLCAVADGLWEAPERGRPEVMLAMARLGRDDLSRRVACANVAVAAAILDRDGPVGLDVGAPLDPFV